jgi:hypothetical protein
MPTETEDLRDRILDLYRRRAREEVHDRAFLRALDRSFLDLCRAVAREHLAAGEAVVAEHHVFRSHLKLTESLLKESEQEAIALYATDRRLLRQRTTLAPARPITCDARDDTRFDDVPYDRVADLKTRYQVRIGEIAAGLVIAGLATLFRGALQITGPVLIGLGALGALHGLLVPTRWIEVRTHEAGASDPIVVHAPRKKTARVLLRLVRSKLPGTRG